MINIRHILFALLAISIFISCLSETEYQKTLDDNTGFKSEIEDIKFGVQNLLKDGKRFFENKDFKIAREKFNTLIERYSDLPEAIESKKYLSIIDEEELWQSANNSTDIFNVSNYIYKYSNGKYINQAKSLKETLIIKNMQNAYESAEKKNSSSAWKEFLNEYPKHIEASSIKKKIIKLEVDEIYGNSETGKMPSFEQKKYGSSSSTRVRITNNTGCDLVVRYSGKEIEMITILEGTTRSIALSSGNYRVAATACGHNYAGTLNLTGEYTSTFYISTTRY